MQLKTKLYEHQKKAVEKLQRIKVGALYMEMGTGKTRTALELAAKRYNAGKIDHVLWLCPCSVKGNLRRDLLKHCNDISMITICGIETLSSSIRTNSELLKLVQEKNVYLIVDESNLVKNHRAKRTENIIRLAQHCKYKLILNGTPISRCEKDLFSQWYILDWRILGYKSFWSFAANHLEYDEKIPGKIRRCLETDYLTRKIAPYTYQVLKSECLDLPPKTYDTVYFDITEEQRFEYEETKDLFLSDVDEFEPSTIYRLLTAVQHVVCGRKITSKLKEKMRTEPIFKNPMDNPRMKTLFDVLEGLDGKIIIWCKYTHEIEDISAELKRKYGQNSAVEFHGKISKKQRSLNVEKFENDARFFVANKTCAGYGLNLQFCNYAIYYSNDWDYATRSQSEDRIHRIGQSNNVHIIDICANYTVDERILKCLWRKERLIDIFKSEIERKKDNIREWIDGKELLDDKGRSE
jgi:SNF2 family DNA or RNA helicase